MRLERLLIGPASKHDSHGATAVTSQALGVLKHITLMVTWRDIITIAQKGNNFNVEPDYRNILNLPPDVNPHANKNSQIYV